MNLTGTSDAILDDIARTLPEVRDVLARVDKRIKRKPMREVEPFQAAALYALARQYNHEGARFLEIGTAVGYSAAVLAEAAPNATIITLNPQADEAEVAQQNLGPYANVKVVVERSWDYLASYHYLPFDFIFVDGDHKNVRLDLPWWDMLNNYGLMVFHDFSKEGTRRACMPVYEACQEFAAWLGRADVMVTDDDGVGMIGFGRRADDGEWGSKTDEVPASVLEAAVMHSIQPANRLAALWRVCRNAVNVPGAVVSLGCGEGGAAGLMLHAAGGERPVWLFDTFEGIPEPGEEDGAKARAKYEARGAGNWLNFSEERARAVWAGLGVEGGICKGMIEQTVPLAVDEIGQIAVLHIDVDWYEPTRAALEALYDSLAPGGIIICDDYGHWEGTERAVDAFRRSQGIHAPLMALDYTAHWWRKE